MYAQFEPVRLFDADLDLLDRRRLDVLIRNPRGFDKQVIFDDAVTGVVGCSVV